MNDAVYFPEVNPYLSIESPSGLLQAVIVVKLFVRQVTAFERKVVTPLGHTVIQREVVGELFGDACFGIRSPKSSPVQGKLMLVVAVVSEREHVAFAEQVMPIE